MPKKQTAANTFIGGAAILSVAGILCKVLGLALRIPLRRIIGDEGMGLYQMAYPLYQTLVAISTAGLPVAIAQRVSGRLARQDGAGAHALFLVARKLLIVLGVVLTAIMMLAAPLASLASAGSSVLVPLIWALAPSLFFVAVICAYRGYFQGMQRMQPTAISQLLEQGVQLVIALILARAFIGYGVAVAAAMALLGATLAEASAMIFMIFTYKRSRPAYSLQAAGPDAPPAQRQVLKDLLHIAVPITLGSMLMPLVNLIDMTLVNNLLARQGLSATVIRSYYGYLTNDAQTLVNMPAVISVAMSMSLVPAISRGMARKDSTQLSSRVAMGYRINLLITIPCALGLMVLAQPMLKFLYTYDLANGLQTATQIMVLLSPSLVFLALMQAGNAILQGMGKERLPVRNLLIGAIVKVCTDVVLLSTPGVGIYGAALATCACYATVAVLNLICIAKYARGHFTLRFPWRSLAVAVIAGGLMAVVVHALYRLTAVQWGLPNIIALAIAVVCGIVVYLALAIAMRGLTYEDMQAIPGGRRLAALLWRGRRPTQPTE